MTKRSRAVIIHDKKLLLITWPNSGIWSTPGGRVENGETAERAIEREILEELGVKILNVRKYFSYSVPEDDGTPGATDCFLVDLEGNFNAQNEISEVRWFSRLELESVKMTDGLENYLLPQLLKDSLI